MTQRKPRLTTRFEDLAAALRACAQGVPCLVAAVELLIGHRFWLRREDFLERFVEVYVEEMTGRGLAFVDWTAAVGAGRLACSDGERQVLAIAASLAEGVPVDLRDALGGLDAPTVALVVAAVETSTGHGPGAVWW
ncbi:MAG TPA: hypothetical protein VI248_07915 [Kineosporiaceae bacterium]